MNSTQFWNYLEKVSRSTGCAESYKTVPTLVLDISCESGLSPVLLTDWLQVGGSDDPQVRLIFQNAHRTQRNISLDYWFIINRTQEQPNGRDAQGRGVWEGQVASMPSQGVLFFLKVSTCSPTWRLSLNPVLLAFYGDFITQACLINSLAIGNSFSLQLLCPPEVWVGLEVPSPDPVVCFFGSQPHSSVLPKSRVTNIIKDTTSVFWGWEPEMGGRPNLYFL